MATKVQARGQSAKSTMPETSENAPWWRRAFDNAGLLLMGLIITGIAGYSTYVQAHDVILHFGYAAYEAKTLPVVADAVMMFASIKMRKVGTAHVTRVICKWAMLGGLTCSAALNAENALLTGRTGVDLAWRIFISLIPVAGLFGMIEMLTHVRKDTVTVTRAARKTAQRVAKPRSAPAATKRPSRARKAAQPVTAAQELIGFPEVELTSVDA